MEYTEQKKEETSFIEDGFTFIGKMVGASVGAGYDATKDVVVGVVYDMPKAIVDGFEKGFEFEGQVSNVKVIQPETDPVFTDETHTEAVEPKAEVISKADYKAQLQAEMDRLDDAIKADETVNQDPFNNK